MKKFLPTFLTFRLFFIFLILTLNLIPLTFLSAFPIISEDDFLVEKNKWEVNQYFYGTKYKDKKSYWGESWTDFRYGILKDIFNLGFVLPFDYWKEESEKESGLSDIRLFGKTKINKSFSALLGLKFATGDEEKSLGSGDNEPFVSFIYKKSANPLDLFLSAGVQFSKNIFFNYNLAIDWNLNNKTAIVCEFIGETQNSEYTQISVAPGTTYSLIEDHFYALTAFQFPFYSSGNVGKFLFMPYVGFVYDY
ncbi:MAG: hypothetical protein WC947_03705 [Elusimicrobiota bacterium]